MTIRLLSWMAPLIVLFALSNLALATETGGIEGYVKDTERDSPLQDAIVILEEMRRQTMTDARGHFAFADLPEGMYNVVVTKMGYQSASREIEVKAGKTREVTFSLAMRVIALEEIVVTAPAERTYPGVAVIEREIEERRPRDIGGVFREIPGASVVKKGGMALDPVIRGFKYDQLNVIIDGGMRVFGACPNRMDPTTAHIQSEDLEKVELFRGPYTVRYGSALGGIVNVVMTKPEQYREPELHTRVELGGESVFDGKRGRVSLFGGREGYDFYLSGGVKNYSNYLDGNGMEIQSSFQVNDYSLKAGWNLSTNHRIQLSHRQSFVREENMQVDLGTKGICGSISFRVSGFYSRLGEYISARLDTSVASRSPGVLGVKRYHNIRTATKIGAEMSGEVELSEALALGTSLAYVSGKNGVTEEPLPEMPPLEGRIHLRYDDPEGRFYGEASGRFAARQSRVSKEFGETETPGFSPSDGEWERASADTWRYLWGSRTYSIERTTSTLIGSRSWI